jgi:hypothetical protein
MTYNRNLTALHRGLTPIHSDQDRANFAPKLAGGIRVLLADGVNYLTFNNLYDSEFDSSEEGVALGRNYIPALDGTIWTISDIQGWWNLTDSEIPNIERGYGDGSFEFVKDTQMRLFLNSAHRAITVCELWDWLSGFNPSSGFMFSSTPELTIINKQMEKDEINGYHSGSSYASIMRNMQFIAKMGIVEYEKYYCMTY